MTDACELVLNGELGVGCLVAVVIQLLLLQQTGDAAELLTDLLLDRDAGSLGRQGGGHNVRDVTYQVLQPVLGPCGCERDSS